MDKEQMDPKTTAIVLVGYQNDYFAADGILRGVIEEPNRVDTVLANTLRLLHGAAATEMTIISTPIILTPEYRALAETIPELLAFGDRVVHVNGKQGFNAFSNTDLETTLQERGITHLALAGMTTSLCIDSMGRAAYERGYSVSILSDCVSARTPGEQAFYCENIFPLYAEVLTSEEMLAQLEPAVV